MGLSFGSRGWRSAVAAWSVRLCVDAEDFVGHCLLLRYRACDGGFCNA